MANSKFRLPLVLSAGPTSGRGWGGEWGRPQTQVRTVLATSTQSVSPTAVPSSLPLHKRGLIADSFGIK